MPDGGTQPGGTFCTWERLPRAERITEGPRGPGTPGDSSRSSPNWTPLHARRRHPAGRYFLHVEGRATCRKDHRGAERARDSRRQTSGRPSNWTPSMPEEGTEPGGTFCTWKGVPRAERITEGPRGPGTPGDRPASTGLRAGQHRDPGSRACSVRFAARRRPGLVPSRLRTRRAPGRALEQHHARDHEGGGHEGSRAELVVTHRTAEE